MAQLLVQYMDVGQGDSTLLVFPNGRSMLIDCGTISSADTPGISDGGAVIEEIKGEIKAGPDGKFHIDFLVLTHGDRDHYNLLGNLGQAGIVFDSLLYGGKIESDYKNGGASTTAFLAALRASNPDSHGGLPIKALQTAFLAGKFFSSRIGDPAIFDMGVAGDPCEVVFLSANATGMCSSDKNANSVTVLVYHQGHKLYFMGDGTKATEQLLVANDSHKFLAPVAAGKTCVLKAGHHGSDTSSTPDWLSCICPNVVVVSSDIKTFGTNGKGMPTDEKIDTFMSLPGLKPLSPNSLSHNIIEFKGDGDYKGFFESRDVGLKAVCTVLAAGQKKLIDSEDIPMADDLIHHETRAFFSPNDLADASDADPLDLAKKKPTRYAIAGLVGTIWWVTSDTNGTFTVHWSGVDAEGNHMEFSSVLSEAPDPSRPGSMPASTLLGAAR
jgi:hypothetical protein